MAERPAGLPQDLGAALRAAGARLRAAGVEGGRGDAARLAAHLLGVGAGEVERRAILGAPTPAGLDALVARRAAREPLQHLVGTAAFRRLDLAVGPGVFVPRPETETLVERALDHLRRRGVGPRPGEPAASTGSVDPEPGEPGEPGATGRCAPPPRVVDLCTGSGAIALAIADEHPGAVVGAVELSPDAHAYAARNLAVHADRLAAQGSPPIDLRLGEAAVAFADWAGTVDLVATNPPYIPDWAVPRDPEVRDHDPRVALYGGGPDGLQVPRALLRHAAALLAPGGLLLMEHGEAQGEALVAVLTAAGDWRDVQDHRDATDRPRVVAATRR